MGLGLLVGGAWVSLFAVGAGSRRLLPLTLAGALVMVAGLALYGIAQALADGTRPADLPGTYLNPGRAGWTTVHLVFSDQRGGPVEVPERPVATARQGRTLRTIQLQRLAYGSPTPNQFYAPATFTAGRWDFQVRAVAADGAAVRASFTLTVPRG